MKRKKEKIIDERHTILFIRENGGTIADKKVKEKRLRQYCEEKKIEVYKVFYYDFGYRQSGENLFINTLIKLLNNINGFDHLIIYDIKEFGDYDYEIFIISKILSSYNILVQSLWDGIYGINYEFNLNLNRNLMMADKLKG